METKLTSAQRYKRDALRWQHLIEMVRSNHRRIDSIDGCDSFFRFELLPDGRVAVEVQPSRR
jgi:hypothetical protein